MSFVLPIVAAGALLLATHVEGKADHVFPNACRLDARQEILKRVFAGKFVVVTGASSGIGRKFAELARNYGAEVVGTSRYGCTETVPYDVTSPEETHRQFFETVCDKYGPVDIVFHNAGRGFAGTVENASLDAIRKVLETNTFGSLKVLRACIPHMARDGVFVQNSSVASQWSDPTQFAYNWSKSGVEHMRTAFMREEKVQYGKPRIKFVSVLPGSVATSFPDRLIMGESRDALAELSPMLAKPVDKMAEFMATRGLQDHEAATAIAASVAHAQASQIYEHRFIVCKEWEENAFRTRINEMCTSSPNEWYKNSYT